MHPVGSALSSGSAHSCVGSPCCRLRFLSGCTAICWGFFLLHQLWRPPGPDVELACAYFAQFPRKAADSLVPCPAVDVMLSVSDGFGFILEPSSAVWLKFGASAAAVSAPLAVVAADFLVVAQLSVVALL
ncbi:hypothetical protein U1Q18_024592 [Sarracenia purpurea var. burkii]